MLCSKVHRAIFDGLKQAVDTLSYTNLHPKEAFFCSAGGEDCEPTLHLAVVEADGWWSCSINPEVGGELTEGQTLWFSSAEDRPQEKERECGMHECTFNIVITYNFMPLLNQLRYSSTVC